MATADRLRLVEIHAAQKFHLRATAVMVAVIYWMMVLTYQDFFLFNPADAEGIFRQTTLWLSLIGWIIAAVGTPIAMLSATSGSLVGLNALPFTATWWPISIVLSQISAFEQTGDTYLDYIFEYPIFVITDIALPVLILLKWSRMRQAITEAEAGSHEFD